MTLHIVGTATGRVSHYADSDAEATYCGKANITWRREQSNEPGSSYRSADCFRCVKSHR